MAASSLLSLTCLRAPTPTGSEVPAASTAAPRPEARPSEPPLPELSLFAGREPVLVQAIEDAIDLDDVTLYWDREYCARLRSGPVVCWRGPTMCRTGNDCDDFRLPPLAGGCGVSFRTPDFDYGIEPTWMASGCYIRADGRGWCRGWKGSPMAVGAVEGAVEITGNPRRGCARTGRGEIWCWRPTSWFDWSGPEKITSSIDAVQLVVNTDRTWYDALHCARTRDGVVQCWGPAAAHLDIDRPEGEPRPIPGLTDAIDLAIDHRLCVVRGGGAVLCSADKHPYPLTPIPGIEDATDVEVFKNDLCARTRGGGVRCAGPSYGGEGSSSAEVVGVREVERVISLERVHCGITRSNDFRCWPPGPSPRAHRVPDLEGVRDIDGSCAVLVDGHVQCWGPRQDCMSVVDY